MGLEDFEGIFKYKLFLPAVQILTWIVMIAGPIYFFDQYRILAISIVTYLFVKTCFLCAMGLKAAKRSMAVLDRVQAKQTLKIQSPRTIYACIVIPTYNESIELLAITLSKLAEHARAKQRYLVYLALQDHSKEPQAKGQQLLKRFKGKFRLMGYTIHKLQKGEQRGKSSNAAFCCRSVEPILKAQAINFEDVLYTSLDADSWMPQIYFEQIDRLLSERGWNTSRYIFAPNQMYTRNHLAVPFCSRVHDQTNGLMQFMLSTNFSNSYFPLSCYSMSYATLQRMGWQDTNSDAIADDYHTAMKAYWKNQGEIQVIPVYAMFNQVNVETGKGYVADVIARFWQAERHIRGLLDVAYNLRMFFREPFRLRTFWMAANHLELNVLGIFSFWWIVGYGIARGQLGIPATTYEQVIFPLYTLVNIIPYFFYFLVVKRSSKVLYSMEKEESWIRIPEYILSISITVPAFLNIALIVAIINSLGDSEYKVAEKSCYGGGKIGGEKEVKKVQ